MLSFSVKDGECCIPMSCSTFSTQAQLLAFVDLPMVHAALLVLLLPVTVPLVPKCPNHSHFSALSSTLPSPFSLLFNSSPISPYQDFADLAERVESGALSSVDALIGEFQVLCAATAQARVTMSVTFRYSQDLSSLLSAVELLDTMVRIPAALCCKLHPLKAP